MIASMYKRRMKAATVISVMIFMIAIGAMLIDFPQKAEEWMNVVSIGMVGLFIGILALSSRKKYLKVVNIHIPEKKISIQALDHLVLKKDIGIFPRLLLFKKDGHFIGKVKPVRTPIIFYPLSFILQDTLIMLLPITYGLFSKDGTLLDRS